MVKICLYFQVHQPTRLRQYSVFDIGRSHEYFDRKKNEEILKKVASKCYLPTNNLILELIRKTDGRFRASYSITGLALEQLEEHSPKTIDSFKALADTGCVEFLNETYHHTLSFLYSKQEFKEQVWLHKKKVKELFKQTPKVFRNTELIYNNELAKFAEGMGYKCVLAEGADHVLGWRSPNFLYKPAGTKKIKLLLKNYRLSDDIAFRFSNKGWQEWPLTAPKFSQWINSVGGEVLNLFMDYETFGEHQWDDTGIFRFLEHLPHEILKNPGHSFKTLSEAVDEMSVVAELDIPHTISWADIERDTSAWTGNSMQQKAAKEIYLLEKAVKQSKNRELIDTWRRLQTSDHFYYMCTKWFSDGDVHKYFNPYETPYDAFITFMNILNDLKLRLNVR